MTDQEFNDLIGYCRLHCRTDRALFHRDMVNKVLKLAGINDRMDVEWASIHHEMDKWCDLAVAKRKQPENLTRPKSEW